MSEELATRDLGLSFEPNLLNAEYRAWKASYEESLGHARSVGKMLAEAKNRLLHGQWKTWLEVNFEGSERTAQVAMQVYGAWEHHPELLRDVDGQLPQSTQGTLSAIRRARQESNQPALNALNQAAEADPSIQRRRLIAALERAALSSQETLQSLEELVGLIENEEPKRAELAAIARECAQAWQRAADALAAGEQLQVA